MKPTDPAPDGGPPLAAGGELPESVSRNIEAVAGFYGEQERRISAPQDLIERTSSFVGRPGYLAFLVAFIAAWIAFNLYGGRFGWAPFDPAPCRRATRAGARLYTRPLCGCESISP